MAQQGRLKDLAGQPVYWLDSANFGPTLGTGGNNMWELKVTGVGGHSGMPQNCVNALELAMPVSLELGRFFRAVYPATEDEKKWGFLSASSLKATVIEAPNKKETKIPSDVTVRVGPRKFLPNFRAKGLERSRPLIEELKKIATAHGATASQVALNWLIQFHGETVVAIPGATKRRHAEENVGSMVFTLSQDELRRIDELSRQFL